MHILQLIQRPQFRGTEVFATQLASSLRSQGSEVTIGALFEWEGAKIKDEGKPIFQLGADEQKRLMDWKGWKALYQLINASKPDVIQANAADTLKYSVLSKKVYGWKAPIVYRNASIASAWIRTPVHRWYNRFLLNQVDAIASVSKAAKDDLANNFGLAARKLYTVPNATPIPGEEDSTVNRGKILKEFGLPEESTILLHIGAFTPEKNHDGLLQIYGEVKKNYPRGIAMLLVGDGPMRASIQTEVKQLGWTDEVFLPGNRQDISYFLQAADVLLLPSKIEGLPGVVLEAMAFQLPVVASPVGGIPEVVEHGSTGFLAPHNQPETFARCVLDILGGPSLQQKLVAQAYHKVKTTYSLEVATQQFIDLYQTVLNGNAKT